MDAGQLINHLTQDHDVDATVARQVIAGDVGGHFELDETYLRGFHDGMHGRIDADDLEAVGHVR